jgi:prevent-host-death family protein
MHGDEDSQMSRRGSTEQEGFDMRSLTAAQAKAHLSQLLQAVEAGEEVEITRRGVPVARLTPVARQPGSGFDLAAFLAATEAQPLHAGSDAASFSRELRDGARF